MSWRVGLVIPSSNSVMEVDFYRRFPHDTTLHTSRMFLDDFTVEAKGRMLDNCLLPAVKAVGTTRPHILVFSSSAAAELHGTQYDRSLCERVGKMIGSVAISVVAAVDQSLRETGASSIAIVTP